MWGAPVIEMIIGAPFMLGMDVRTALLPSHNHLVQELFSFPQCKSKDQHTTDELQNGHALAKDQHGDNDRYQGINVAQDCRLLSGQILQG